MAEAARVLVAVTGAPWESAVISTLVREPARIRVVRRCVDVADLLAAASAGYARVAVVAADLPQLDRDTLLHLASAGVAVVGVAAGDSAEEGLLRLGVSEVVSPGVGVDELLASVGRAAADLRTPSSTALADPSRAAGGSRDTSGAPLGPTDVVEDTVPGTLIAVWGPTGAPGRTTTAVTVAAEAALAGRRTLLADVDVYGGAVAQVLGMLDESPGVAAACRAASVGQLDRAALARHAREVDDGLRVLTGIARTSRWPEVRPAALETVWRVATDLVDVVVADCGFALEQDEELSFDTAAPRRNGATLVTLERADVVLAVGSADPIGLQRLVRGLAELAELRPEPPRVVVNRVRRSVVGADPERQIADALHRYAGVEDVVLVPDDPAAADAALLQGRSLTEIAPDSPARRALATLTADVLGLPAPVAPGRWRPRVRR